MNHLKSSSKHCCRRRLASLAGAALIAGMLAGPSYSQEAVNADADSYTNVTSRMAYLEDPGGTYTIDTAVKSSPWKQLGKKYVNYGYTGSAYWFRLTLRNPTTEIMNRLLEIDFPTLDHVELYRPDGKGAYTANATGDRLPFDSREIRDANFLFRLDLPPGMTTVYLRIQNEGSLRFRAWLLTLQKKLETKNIQQPLLWLIYGMMLLTVLFHFFVFILMKERLYLYFSAFTLLLLLFQFNHWGFAFQFLWPRWTWWANVCPPILLNLLGASSAFFISTAMDTEKTNRLIDRILMLFRFVLFPAAAAGSLFIPVRAVLSASYYIVMFYSLMIVASTVYYFARGNRFARYFLLGIGWVASFAILGSLNALGKLPANTLMEWSTDAGFLGLILFASLGLVDRIKELNSSLRVSKDEIARKNVVLGNKNQELEATMEELEASMEELAASNEEFEAQNEELMRAQEELTHREAQLKTSLGEKDILLKEVHHRVKNNMQIISSLMGLQEKSVLDERDLDLFRNSRGRIKTMAMIHEKLYQTDNFSRIDMNSYISSLVHMILEQFAFHQQYRGTSVPDITVTAENVLMGIDTAIPCALILNELVTNALKHAFPDGRKGAITIRMRSGEGSGYTVSVTDNGVGLNQEKDIEEIETLGLSIVKALVKQLNGTAKIESKNGTDIIITF